MTVDLSKIKPGDEVTYSLFVGEVGPSGYLWAYHNGGKILLNAADIVSHTPTLEPLAVGDRVKWANTRGTWEIAAIRDVWAWLADPMDKGIIVALSELERVP